MEYRFSNQVSEQVVEQMGPLFAPVFALWDANCKAFETVMGHQAELLDTVVVSCSELAEDLSKADSMETVWTLHKQCSSKLQGVYVDTFKKAPLAFKQSEELMMEALENTGDFSVLTAEFEKGSKAFTEASTTATEKSVEAAKPVKKASPKKRAAKKSAPKTESEPVKAETEELETNE